MGFDKVKLAGVHGNRFSGLWHNCPLADLRADPNRGTVQEIVFDDFHTSADVNAAEAYWSGKGVKLYGSGGAPVTAYDGVGGGATLASDGDNEGVGLSSMVYPYQISRSHGNLWGEICLQDSTIADTKHGFFFGLLEAAALSATVPIAAAGTLTDNNFVGWHKLEGDGDAADAVYRANGVTQVTAGADLATLVAATDIKLGFTYSKRDFKLRWFVNGVQVDEVTVIAAAGTDFPNDVRLGWVFSLLNATGTTPGSVSLKGIRVAQLFV